MFADLRVDLADLVTAFAGTQSPPARPIAPAVRGKLHRALPSGWRWFGLPKNLHDMRAFQIPGRRRQPKYKHPTMIYWRRQRGYVPARAIHDHIA